MQLPNPAVLFTASLLLTILAIVTSCVSGPAASSQTTKLSCAGWKPICLTSKEVDTLSNLSYNQILEHNLFGHKQCGWEPEDCK